MVLGRRVPSSLILSLMLKRLRRSTENGNCGHQSWCECQINDTNSFVTCLHVWSHYIISLSLVDFIIRWYVRQWISTTPELLATVCIHTRVCVRFIVYYSDQYVIDFISFFIFKRPSISNVKILDFMLFSFLLYLLLNYIILFCFLYLFINYSYS